MYSSRVSGLSIQGFGLRFEAYHVHVGVEVAPEPGVGLEEGARRCTRGRVSEEGAFFTDPPACAAAGAFFKANTGLRSNLNPDVDVVRLKP